MILSRRHLRLIDTSQQLGLGGHDWTSTVIRLKGITLHIIGIYLTSGWPAQENQKKLAAIADGLAQMGLPFVILGDFNCTPEEFAELRWHTLVKGTIIKPDCEFTCTIPPCRIIDFAVASSEVLDLLSSFGPEPTSPFRPHLGLVFRLHSSARSVCKRVLIKPRNIPEPLETEKSDGGPDEWHQAKRVAEGKLEDNPLGIMGRPGQALMLSQCKPQWEVNNELGRSWASFCLTAEVFHLTRAGIPQNDQRPYLGRGQYPTFKIKPVVPHTHPQQLGSSVRVQFWSVLAARLRELAVLTERGVGLGQQVSHRRFIAQLVREQARSPRKIPILTNGKNLLSILGILTFWTS
jgi:hypothetical protein